MANLRAPLPHFLNLPLPSIQPINQKSSNQSPIVFKMTLSADQFEELLRMDSEVEEGEEGGLRLEFDQNQINPTGGRLHLTPTRNLLLNQPRSGPIRTNKPEEIYHHNILPTNTSQSRSPLRGLFKIPIGTPVFALQPNPVEPINTTQPTPNQPSRDTLPITHTLLNQPDQALNLNSNTQHSQREKEKLAGQKLKERRLEAERKKKEKQMVLLPTDTVPNGPKKGRPVKARESKQKSTASKWTSTHNSQPPAPSHIIQATVSNPVNGHSTRKAHLASHPEQATDQISNRSPNPTVFPLTKSLDTTPLLPPINTFSPSPQSAPRTRGTNASSTSNTNRRNKPPSLVEPNHSLLLTSQLSPEPFSATKLSATSTVLTSLSEESEADPRTLEQAPPVPERKQKPPNRRNNTSGSAKQSSSKTVPSNNRGIIKALPETPAASETQGSANFTTQSKKLSTGPAPVAVNGTASNLSHESSQPHVLPSKKRKQIEQTETPATSGEVGITRTKMAVRKDNLEKKVKPVVLGGVPSAQEAIGIKQSSNVKVKRAAENKAVRDAGVGAVENHRKRTLEVDAANGGTYPLTKRVKPEQASGLVAPGSMIVNPMGIGAIPTSLPTIRKVNRESEEVNSNSSTTNKKVKKKKKVKPPIDYTSSEDEGGGKHSTQRTSVERNEGRLNGVEEGRLADFKNVEEGEEEEREEEHHNRRCDEAHDKQQQHMKEEQQLLSQQQSRKEYQKNRMIYYEVYSHYQYVCDRIESIKRSRTGRGVSSKGGVKSSVEEIEELVNEYIGLESELDSLRKVIMV